MGGRWEGRWGVSVEKWDVGEGWDSERWEGRREGGR